MTVDIALVVATIGFAFVNGFNDGGALLVVGLRVRSVRPLGSLVVLAAAVVLTPLIVGTAVATTLVARLVDLEGEQGSLALLIAVVVSVAVSYGLARRGLPTSLTLALVGSIAGAGVGAGLAVSWVTVTVVLALAAAAPTAGLVLGWLLTKGVATLPAAKPLRGRIRLWQGVGFFLLCLAYGANDGQKMLAVAAVTFTSVHGVVEPTIGVLLLIGVIFFVGSAAGLPRFVRTLGGGVAPLQPTDAVISQFSAASVVLSTAALGAPVSMTQSISGTLVGVALPRGPGSVRWPAAMQIGVAWLVTLPLSLGLAAATAFAIDRF